MSNEKLLADIKSVLAEYEAVEKKYQIYPLELGKVGCPMMPPSVFTKTITLLTAALLRLAPRQSVYWKQFQAIDGQSPKTENTILRLAGVLQALCADYAADRITTFQELVRSDLFGNMLEAADYLLGESYKDPAAVMAGGVLEQHLRELCRKHNIGTALPSGKPKMIAGMNADLAKAVYSNIEQTHVTAWAGIRNAAAHGDYGKYDENQVRQMITGIRDFISKYPA